MRVLTIAIVARLSWPCRPTAPAQACRRRHGIPPRPPLADYSAAKKRKSKAEEGKRRAHARRTDEVSACSRHLLRLTAGDPDRRRADHDDGDELEAAPRSRISFCERLGEPPRIMLIEAEQQHDRRRHDRLPAREKMRHEIHDTCEKPRLLASALSIRPCALSLDSPIRLYVH